MDIDDQLNAKTRYLKWNAVHDKEQQNNQPTTASATLENTTFKGLFLEYGSSKFIAEI